MATLPGQLSGMAEWFRQAQSPQDINCELWTSVTHTLRDQITTKGRSTKWHW